jgi:hypothetical protein
MSKINVLDLDQLVGKPGILGNLTKQSTQIVIFESQTQPGIYTLTNSKHRSDNRTISQQKPK